MSEDNQEPQNQDMQQRISELEEKVEANLNGWKRTLADFQNYQRRKEEENKDLIEFAREVAVAKLLPTLDSIGQAIRHAPEIQNEDYEKWKNGLLGILQQLDKALAELGVKKIEALGKKFDPKYHEAVREVEAEGEPGTVVEEYQIGYELNGKVIRPSQVTIIKDK